MTKNIELENKPSTKYKRADTIFKIIVIGMILYFVFTLGWYDVFMYLPTDWGSIIIATLIGIVPLMIILVIIIYVSKNAELRKEIDVKSDNEDGSNMLMKKLFQIYQDYEKHHVSIVSFVVVFILGMVFEELLFRVLLFDFYVRLGMNVYLLALMSSLLFAVMHYFLYKEWSHLVSGTLIGCYFCYLYVIGGFWLALIIHTAWDTILFLISFVVFSWDNDKLD